MPFTPTHVLAVVPIAAAGRGALPIAALAIGSMIPDLPLFVPGVAGYGTTHSAAGLVTACWPLGLGSFLLFRLAMRRPLFALLPEAIRRRCGPLAEPAGAITAGLVGRASAAVVIGAATHVSWDSFTHRGRWGTRLVPALGETALTFRGHAIPGFQVLQHGSTLVGLPMLAVLLAIWLGRRRPGSLAGEPVLAGPTKVAAIAGIVTLPAIVAAMVWARVDATAYQRLGLAIVRAGLASMVATLAYCLGFRLFESRTGRAE